MYAIKLALLFTNVKYWEINVVTICIRTKIIKRLLQKGANKYLRDNRGRTPYDLALEKNKIQIGEFLY